MGGGFIFASVVPHRGREEEDVDILSKNEELEDQTDPINRVGGGGGGGLSLAASGVISMLVGECVHGV